MTMMIKATVLLCIVAIAAAASRFPVTSRTTVAQANVVFTKKLYQMLSQTRPGNLFMSPLSAHIAFAMVYLGAGGNTAAQLASALELPSDVNSLKDGYRSFLGTITAHNVNVTLDLANRLFVAATLQLNPAFRNDIIHYFLAGEENVDFVKTEAARQTINTWVDNQTHHKIKQLFKPGILNPDTILVLVNAIYFKGQWESRFEFNKTQKAKFHLSANQHVQVDMMYQTGRFQIDYIQHLNTTVLRLPYKGDKISMLVLVPDSIDGLPNLEANLHQVNFQTLANNRMDMEVTVGLPKFRIESSINLKRTMKKLGVKDLFQKADLSGIAQGNLLVSDAVQKTFIEVNEEGSEAAAVTGVVMVPLSLNEKSIIANRPFLFAIRDDSTLAVLFLGRYARPESSHYKI